MLLRLQLADMDAAAMVRQTTFDHTFPWLAGFHTPADTQWFFRERLINTCEVWGSFDGSEMTGTWEQWSNPSPLKLQRVDSAEAAAKP